MFSFEKQIKKNTIKKKVLYPIDSLCGVTLNVKIRKLLYKLIIIHITYTFNINIMFIK